MVSPGHLFGFALAAFAIIIVPGPSVLFTVSRAVALGRRAALLTVIGNAAGAYVQVTAVAVGIGAVVRRSIVVFTAIKLVGAVYLVFLGVMALRHRRGLATVLDAATRPRPMRHVVRDGFIVGVANPKVIVFFAAILPQFVDPARGHTSLQILFLGAVFCAIALVSDSAWGLAAGGARSWLARSPDRLPALGGLGGLVMIGLGVRLLLTGRKD